MLNGRIGVGIIGASPGKGWAAETHIPAVKSLPDFELRAVSTSRAQSARAAKRLFDVPLAFDDYRELLTRPEVDLAVVSIRVPRHYEVVSAAIDAGKAVYCEWPLGNGLDEAISLAGRARAKGVGNWVGLQSRSAPAVNRIRDLIGEGYIGQVLSTTLVGSALHWGGEIDEAHAFILDKRNGVTPLTISCGHRVDALCYCLGEFRVLCATVANRRATARIIETGEIIPKSADDQIAISGMLESGAVAAIHYRGGSSRGINLLWEINGTEGDLQLTDPAGHGQMHDVRIFGARRTEQALRPLDIPPEYLAVSPAAAPGLAYNVAQHYTRLAHDMRNGTHLCPTFEDAVVRHRMLEAIERSATRGEAAIYL